MGRFAASAIFYGGKENLCGGDKGKFFFNLAIDSIFKYAKLIKNGKCGFDDTIDGKKASASATRRTTESETSPSFHWAPEIWETMVK